MIRIGNLLYKFRKSIFKKENELLQNNLKNHSNIIQSKVQNLELVHSDALVQYSELRGNIQIGPRSLIHKCLLDGQISIGSNTTINGPCTEFYSIKNPIKIGNFCSIARNTAIQEHNHDTEKITSYFIRYRIFGDPYGTDAISKGGITVGNDVWIGTGSVILSGVTISDGVVIGANSVVTNDIPPYAIVGGTPAKILKYRFSQNIIDRLLEIQWWNWEVEKIKKNKDLFYDNLTIDKLVHFK